MQQIIKQVTLLELVVSLTFQLQTQWVIDHLMCYTGINLTKVYTGEVVGQMALTMTKVTL